MPILDTLPAGCRMPAEWEPHEATWIAWPHNADDWPGKFDAVGWVYAEIARPLPRSERVCLLVPPASETHTAILQNFNLDWGRIELIPLPTDRVWTRDYAPLFARAPDGSVIATDWRFNAWAKY